MSASLPYTAASRTSRRFARRSSACAITGDGARRSAIRTSCRLLPGDATSRRQAMQRARRRYRASRASATMRYMRRALELAAHGLYTTDPNPRVGCVLVRDGRVLGEGWHERAGEAHAEVRALEAAGGAARRRHRLRDARTVLPHRPHAAVRSGADRRPRRARGVRDRRSEPPGQRRRRCGAARGRHRDRGGSARGRGARAQSGILQTLQAGLPLGAGRSSERASTGARRWPMARAAGSPAGRRARTCSGFRARSSCVLSGIGTVLADDPALNVRIGACTGSRCGWCSTARCVRRRRRASSAARGQVLCSPRTTMPRGAPHWRRSRRRWKSSPGEGTGVSLRAALRAWPSCEVERDLGRGRAAPGRCAVRARLVDEFIVYLAPSLLRADGARAGGACRRLPGWSRGALQFSDFRAIGPDLRLTAVPPAPSDPHVHRHHPVRRPRRGR